jgi:hypothetical protein
VNEYFIHVVNFGGLITCDPLSPSFEECFYFSMVGVVSDGLSYGLRGCTRLRQFCVRIGGSKLHKNVGIRQINLVSAYYEVQLHTWLNFLIETNQQRYSNFFRTAPFVRSAHFSGVSESIDWLTKIGEKASS